LGSAIEMQYAVVLLLLLLHLHLHLHLHGTHRIGIRHGFHGVPIGIANPTQLEAGIGIDQIGPNGPHASPNATDDHPALAVAVEVVVMVMVLPAASIVAPAVDAVVARGP